MNNMEANWDSYFKFRDVEAEYYSNYRIPPYIQLLLPPSRDSIICDIGCGFGQILRSIHDLGYKNIYGIEPSSAACDRLKKLQITYYKGLVNEVVIPEFQKADFGIMSHVLEHIKKDDIVTTLVKIRENIIKPGGRLLIAVPNAQSYTGAYWRYEDWTHETLFTSGSLLYVMRAAGFRKLSIWDPDSLMNTRKCLRPCRRLMLWIYYQNWKLWMRVTNSAIHKPSPVVFSYEVKAVGEA
jgi:2-polyprenyl-3-methyl-5-hydroxy-6-metoxy-1,4-benzoquinol methylase